MANSDSPFGGSVPAAGSILKAASVCYDSGSGGFSSGFTTTQLNGTSTFLKNHNHQQPLVLRIL